MPGEIKQNSKKRELTITKAVDILIRIIDVLVIIVKKKKFKLKIGNNNHHPDLSISCNLLTLTLIPGRKVTKKINLENEPEYFSVKICSNL